jgi:hypothetical protein
MQELHTWDGQGFRKRYYRDNMIGMFPQGVGESVWDVIGRIEDYLMRNLTNPSDILNGILGILRAFEIGPHHIRHCWGLPLLLEAPRPKSLARFRKPWSPTMSFIMGLGLDLKSPAARRARFPSWSWTGWLGRVKWKFEEHRLRRVRIDPDVKLGIELVNGQLIDWDTF